jgi:hypothetical protein
VRLHHHGSKISGYIAEVLVSGLLLKKAGGASAAGAH